MNIGSLQDIHYSFADADNKYDRAQNVKEMLSYFFGSDLCPVLLCRAHSKEVYRY